MSQIVLTNIQNPKNTKTNVQYSYPPIGNITGTNKSFIIQSIGLNPNFSASINDKTNTYISGICIKAAFINKKHKIGSDTHNYELVLEHKKSDNKSFYVVIPVKQNGSADPTQLDLFFEPELQSQVIDLNTVLKNNNKMSCYKNSKNDYIFVFENPVSLKSPLNNLPILNVFDKRNSPLKITNVRQINDDEIVCEYVTETDATAKPVDKKMFTTLLSWVFILLGLILCLVYGLTIVSNKMSEDTATIIYMFSGGLGVMLLMIYIRLFMNTQTRKVQYGSITIFSLMLILLTLFAYNGYFSKKTII